MTTLVVIVASSPHAQEPQRTTLVQGVVLETFSGNSGLQYPPGILATLEEGPSFAQSQPGEATIVLSNGHTVTVPTNFLFNLKTGKPLRPALYPSPV